MLWYDREEHSTSMGSILLIYEHLMLDGCRQIALVVPATEPMGQIRFVFK